MEQVLQEVAVLEDCWYVDPATQLAQVCSPVAGDAEILYPLSHALQSTVDVVSHSVAPEPVATVGEPFEQVHVLARHVNVLNLPLVPHVAVPPPAYPALHVTVTVCVVVPVMDPLAALLELATLPAAVQVLAEHVKVLNLPLVPQVAVPPPVYPVLHVTVTVCEVVPV